MRASEAEAGGPPGVADLAGRSAHCGCTVGDDQEDPCSCDERQLVGDARDEWIAFECEHYCPIHDLHHCPFCWTPFHIHFAFEAAGSLDVHPEPEDPGYDYDDFPDLGDTNVWDAYDYIIRCGLDPRFR